MPPKAADLRGQNEAARRARTVQKRQKREARRRAKQLARTTAPETGRQPGLQPAPEELGACRDSGARNNLNVEHWSLTTLREKLVKIGARIVRHGRYVVFQLAEVVVPRAAAPGMRIGSGER